MEAPKDINSNLADHVAKLIANWDDLGAESVQALLDLVPNWKTG